MGSVLIDQTQATPSEINQLGSIETPQYGPGKQATTTKSSTTIQSTTGSGQGRCVTRGQIMIKKALGMLLAVEVHYLALTLFRVPATYVGYQSCHKTIKPFHIIPQKSTNI